MEDEKKHLVRLIEVGPEGIIDLNDIDFIRKEVDDPEIRKLRLEKGLTIRFQVHLYGTKPLENCVYCDNRLNFMQIISEEDGTENRGFYACDNCELIYDLPLRAEDRPDLI